MAMARIDLIKKYFFKGWTYATIQKALDVKHNITLCLRQIKNILRQHGLSRRSSYNVDEVISFIKRQLELSGQQHGYRFMHVLCKQNGFKISRDDVYEIMKVLDPGGLHLRKRRRLIRRRYYGIGPNQIWHVDSYDKLKPYGIAVNGCIDGFSRHIIWMEASYTASDPAVIAGYYMDSVKQLGGCSMRLRCDLGTENTTMCHIHKLIHQASNPDQNWKSVIVGKSTGNQRIESWWNIYRRQNSEYYITLFHLLQAEGLFSGDTIDKELIRFCFLQIVQVCVC